MPSIEEQVAAQKLECPTCKAKPGYRCTRTGGGRPNPTPHATRIKAARSN